MTTLQAVELRVLGPLQAQQGGAPVAIPGAKPRAVLTMLGLHGGAVVSADTLIELLWGDDPPRTAAKALQTHISALRRALGDGVVLTLGTGWTLADTAVDASRYKVAARLGRDAAAAGNTTEAVTRLEEALSLWRGIPELPEGRRGSSEKTRWIEAHAALVEDRADALLATGRAAEIVGELEAAVADAPLRERRWGQLMLALYRAGRQGEALGAYQRARSLLADQLGVDPGPELRRLEAAIVGQDVTLDTPVAQQASSVTRAVTFLLTDIEGSTAAWEADADAMAAALARHDELVEHIVTSRGGRLIKTRGEGDATFSVFDRPSAAAAAAIELQDAIAHEPWALGEPLRIRVALHTGEVELRDGDYFGRAVNRAARLRSVAAGGQILCSGATAELVIDSLSDDVVLADLGVRQLRNLARPEHVFELRMHADDDEQAAPAGDARIERPELPAVLTGHGPFVGRSQELEALSATWQSALSGGMRAVLIAGEPGVGKTRLAGEWSRQAYEQDAVVLYGRCDEDLGAPYQPFAEALRSLVPCLAAGRLRGLRGVEALLPLVPGLTEVLPDLAAPTRADPDTERYALFDAVVALLESASKSAPVVLILDDLHWAAKSTLLLLRHLLRFGDQARVQILGTYRSTDLDRSHPLAAMLADLHRDGTAERLALGGLDEDDVTTYVAEAGYDDEELGRALASVTGGNPFFLIEALRHVDESGGAWDQSTLPQGVREAVSRRLSRLPVETNKALAAAAVVGSRFAVDMVERVVEQDLVDAFDEACKAGIVIEEPGGRYRFNHALIRQSLLAELPSVRRMRLHQRIATTLESQSGADDELLAELAHHYFECAWAGNAAKAVEYCRRAADQAMARLAYEGAADLYDHALHALEEIDDELPDREDLATELLVARCEALLAAGDVVSAAGAVTQLKEATRDSARIAAWAACYDGQLSMLVHPEHLDTVESTVGAAADTLNELGDAAGEAKAHTVRALALGRLGRIGDSEIALDRALTAARRAREHRRVNAVLAVAPLAALWGPNPVPRAGGRCLDVVRLLRITTDSPAVEATSTRCQAVLEAFRGRAPAARRMIESARRTVSELGLRHALLEVEQFAGIVEMVIDDPVAAEPHLRKAYTGFRRMGLDADTAETAALLGRASLALGLDAEADELCSESERLAGHALKASIAWRTLRAQLMSRRGDHNGARQSAEAAIALAERTDALVDHGDACLALATVLDAAGETTEAGAAAARAAALYDQKGAAALADRARTAIGEEVRAPVPLRDKHLAELVNETTRVAQRVVAAVNRRDWDAIEQLFALTLVAESHRKIVGHSRMEVTASRWSREMTRYFDAGMVLFRHAVVAVRGERLALIRFTACTDDSTPGAPLDELLSIVGLDESGRVSQQLSFDLADADVAMVELDAAHATLEGETLAPRFENAASRVYERFKSGYEARDMDALSGIIADGVCTDDRRRVVNAGVRSGWDAIMAELNSFIEIGAQSIRSDVMATRGDRLILNRSEIRGWDQRPDPFGTGVLELIEVDADERLVGRVVFDADDIDGAFTELDSRYLAGEAAPYAHAWSATTQAYTALCRKELPPTTPDWVDIDRRRLVAIEAGGMTEYLRATWAATADVGIYVKSVHRLSDRGAVVTHSALGTTRFGFDAEWPAIALLAFEGDLLNRVELFDEADLDAALARFDELHRHARRLENAATRVSHRYAEAFTSRDWPAVSEQLADDFCIDDRRRTVNGGIRRGRGAAVTDLQAAASVGFVEATGTVVATRGGQLSLTQARFSGGDDEPFENELLNVIEVDADERMTAVVVFETGDIDAAIAELDARYLAGEAAPFAQTWSTVMEAHATFNRRDLPSPRTELIDHRPVVTVHAGDPAENIRDMWELTPDLKIHIESVHRLSERGAVVTQASHGTSQTGFEAEWRDVELISVDGDLVMRCEVFDEGDLDAAIERFENLHPPKPRLDNAASRMLARFLPLFATREWDLMAEMLAEDICLDDRRRIINAGVIRGRESEIANLRAVAEAGVEDMTSTPVATRGERLVLHRLSFYVPDWPEEQNHEMLEVVEITEDGLASLHITFDLDDFDAAIAELDARYMSGEGSAHSRTWSAAVRAQAALDKRRELPPTTADWVNLDHRRGISFAPGDMATFVRAGWGHFANETGYIETVHAINGRGTVYVNVFNGSSAEGFDAEWRFVELMTVNGDLISRAELFDEADLDVALAKFDQLCQPASRLENAATRVADRYASSFTSRDWAAMAELITEDFSIEDRRPTVNAGIRHGRDAGIEEQRAVADVGFTDVARTVLAIRGEHLALVRAHYTGDDDGPEPFEITVLHIVEIAHERVTAVVTFDAGDIDAAFQELDARYVASEEASHAHTYSVIGGAYSALNRREIPSTTPDWVNLDHRQGATVAPGNLVEFVRAAWELEGELFNYIEAVHRVTPLGAAVTRVTIGASGDGFDAEWRTIDLMLVDGDLVSRFEMFDDGDLDAALTRFDELARQEPRLDNAATRIWTRLADAYDRRDLDRFVSLTTAQGSLHDRRKGLHSVQTGLARRKNLQAILDLSPTTWRLTAETIAIRGSRLSLSRIRWSDMDAADDPTSIELLAVTEVDDGGILDDNVSFDVGDTEAAFIELEARYLAGEAAPYADCWYAITGICGALNRQELPETTADWVSLDHRRGGSTAPGDWTTDIRAAWQQAPDIGFHISAVHRLSGVGAVMTGTAAGTSREGFEAEWRLVALLMVDDDKPSRIEVFDEDDLDAALARFDELQPRKQLLDDATQKIIHRFESYFAARDWNSLTDVFAIDYYMDDRRRVVNAGTRHGRESAIQDLRVGAEVGLLTVITVDVIATRGTHLTLMRIRARGAELPDVHLDALQVVEHDGEKLSAAVVFDLDDIDAAFEELDARYLASDGAAHAHTWAVIVSGYSRFNQEERPTADWVNVDHRRGTPFASSHLNDVIRGAKDLTPDMSVRIEAVHRLEYFGAVITNVSSGTSQDGIGAEWRMIQVLALEGDRVIRCELFDEADLDAALARFDELGRPASEEPGTGKSPIPDNGL